MKLHSLTSQGTTEKLADLYALSDMALASQALAIALDFRSWIKAHFILTPAQKRYVDGINDEAARWFGAQCSACFMNRVDINLVYPAPPRGRYAKWTGSESTVKLEADGKGNQKLTGSLTFTIDYVG